VFLEKALLFCGKKFKNDPFAKNYLDSAGINKNIA
jgi:hypothetical protein